MSKTAEIAVLTALGVVYSVVGIALFYTGKKDEEKSSQKKKSQSGKKETPAPAPALPKTIQISSLNKPKVQQASFRCNSSSGLQPLNLLGREFDTFNKAYLYMKILAFTENDEKRDEFFNKLMAVEDDLKKLKELDDEITKNKKDSTFYKYRPQIIFLVLFLWVFTNKEKLVPLLEKTGTISSSSCVASIDAPFTKLKEWWVKNKYEEEFLNNSINDLKGKAEDFWKNEENQLTVKYNEIIGHNKS